MISYKLCFKKNPNIESYANTELYTVLDFGKTDQDLNKVVPLGIKFNVISKLNYLIRY